LSRRISASGTTGSTDLSYDLQHRDGRDLPVFSIRAQARPSQRTGRDTLRGMDDTRARELLAEERSRIERELEALRGGDSGEPEPGDRDSEDLYEQERDTGLGQDLAQQLEAVERAEARLAAGTYGVSIESGKPIPDERLEAVPTAERTVEEQTALGL
jgi:DnaK suppressor protein